MEDLSEWRAEQKRKRKANAQREYRRQLREKELMMMMKVNELKGEEVYKIKSDDDGSKHHQVYLPPPEELSTMDESDLSEWRAKERKKRKLEQQRLRRDKLKEEKKKAKAADEDESKILSKKIIAQNTAKWRKHRNEKLALLLTTYNNYQISRGLPTMSLDPKGDSDSGSKSNNRPSYEPPPEELKKMTRQELSEWRSEQKRMRKAEAQREYRKSVKEKEDIMKQVVDGLSPNERLKFAQQAVGGDPKSARDGLPKVDDDCYKVRHDESRKVEASKQKNMPQGRDQGIMKEAVDGLSSEKRLKFAGQAGEGGAKSAWNGLSKMDEGHYNMGEASKKNSHQGGAQTVPWGGAQTLPWDGAHMYSQVMATASDAVSEKLMSIKYELARREQEMAKMAMPVPIDQFSRLPAGSKNAQICFQKAKNDAFFIQLYTSKHLLDVVTKCTLPLTREQAHDLSLSQRCISRTMEGGAFREKEASVNGVKRNITEEENLKAKTSEEEHLNLLAHANTERKLKKGCLVPVKVFEEESRGS